MNPITAVLLVATVAIGALIVQHIEYRRKLRKAMNRVFHAQQSRSKYQGSEHRARRELATTLDELKEALEDRDHLSRKFDAAREVIKAFEAENMRLLSGIEEKSREVDRLRPKVISDAESLIGYDVFVRNTRRQLDQWEKGELMGVKTIWDNQDFLPVYLYNVLLYRVDKKGRRISLTVTGDNLKPCGNEKIRIC